VSRTSTFRKLAAFAVVGTIALVGSSAALADSCLNGQNSDLTVSASLASSGADPQIAGPADVITEQLSITNVSAIKQTIRVITNSDWMFGHDFDHLLNLQPGASWSWAKPIHVSPLLSTGVYSVTVLGLGTGCYLPSSASASISVFSG
jgi:hypothetical protein